MPIPDFQSFLKPLLELASDGKEHSITKDREIISKDFQFTAEDLSELLPSGKQRKFDNRVAWAKTHLLHAKVISSPKRGHFIITERGKELLKQNHTNITLKILNQYPEHSEFRNPTKSTNTQTDITTPESIEETPEENLQNAYQSIRKELANELLEIIINNSPQFFETLVVDLMVAMGYGGSRLDAGQAIGKSGDEGIDGIIKEDKLGLDVVYLQAKRWDNTVGRPEIQKFVGALQGKRAKKGVFITTSNFSKEAEEYVTNIDTKVVLIDGNRLTELMIDHNLGTTTSETFEIKKVDTDYFEEP